MMEHRLSEMEVQRLLEVMSQTSTWEKMNSGGNMTVSKNKALEKKCSARAKQEAKSEARKAAKQASQFAVNAKRLAAMRRRFN